MKCIVTQLRHWSRLTRFFHLLAIDLFPAVQVPHQTRDMRIGRRPLAPTSVHEAFSRVGMHGLETDVAFLALCVLGARLDGLRDGLLVFFVGVVLFCVAAAVYLLADLLVAAAPVVMLASFVAVSRVASNASRRQR